MTTSSQVYTTATSVSSSFNRLNTTTLATSTATSVTDVCMATTTTVTTTTVASTIQLSSQRSKCAVVTVHS